MSDLIVLDELGELDDLLKSEQGWVVVNFTAPEWCAPCRQFKPHYHMAAEKHDGNDTTFVEFDCHYDADPGAKYNFMSVPTTIVFRQGTERFRLDKRTAPLLLKEFEEKTEW